MENGKITVEAKIKAKPGMEDKVREELLSLVASTRKEAGCMNYDLHQSPEDKSLFMFYENWRSKKDLDEHIRTPHFLAFEEKAGELLAEPPTITLWKMIS